MLIKTPEMPSLITNSVDSKMTKNIPGIITNSIERLKISNTNKDGPFLRSLHHYIFKNGKIRQKRSDRRYNIILILRIIISEIELGTLGWGNHFIDKFGDLDFWTRGIDYLMEKTGLSWKTVCRCLQDLVKCGYLKVTRIQGEDKNKTKGKNSDGEIRYYSLRQLTKKLFLELGFQMKTINTAIHKKQKKSMKQGLHSQIISKYAINKIKKLYETLGKPKKQYDKNKFKKRTANSGPVKTTKPKQKHSPTLLKNIADKAIEIANINGTSISDEYKQLLLYHT